MPGVERPGAKKGNQVPGAGREPQALGKGARCWRVCMYQVLGDCTRYQVLKEDAKY